MKIVTDSSELKELIKEARGERFVTVDTEFIRDKTYYPELCLVQIGLASGPFAIDTLAKDIDLTPLFDLMQDKKVLKVFHAAQQDIGIFVDLNGKVPEPMFDVQVAAQVLGHGESASYATLVKSICGVDLDKSHRFTNWQNRPLSDKQLQYALSDVTYLREIYVAFSQQLKDLGRESWIEEEMQYLTDVENYISKPEDAWEKLKIRSTSGQFLAVVRAVAAWREKRAQALNVPRGRVLKDENILEIAATAPEKPEALLQMRGLHHSATKPAVAAELIEVVQAGLKAGPPKLPKRHHQLKPNAALVELLKVLLKMKCEEERVSQKVVAKIQDIELIALNDKPDVPAMKGWRYDVFGKHALDLKHGRLALSAKGKHIVLVELPGK